MKVEHQSGVPSAISWGGGSDAEKGCNHYLLLRKPPIKVRVAMQNTHLPEN